MLVLTKAVVGDIIRHAERYPFMEVTGFVAEGPQGQRVQYMRNVSPYPDRYYDWDPAEMMTEYTKMDAQGERPVLIYHSHPNGRSQPSETDMQGALNVGLHYGIVYPEGIEETRADGWVLQVWECIEMGILLHAPHEVAP